jgi:hypothetical protein
LKVRAARNLSTLATQITTFCDAFSTTAEAH